MLPGTSNPPSATAALPPHPRLQVFYPPSVHFVSFHSSPSPPPHVPGCFSIPLASFCPLNASGFLNRMLGVFESRALNCYTLFHLILLTLFVSKYLILIHLPLSGSPDYLFCDLIAPTAAPSFSSDRAYLSLSFLLSLFLRLTPTLIM